MQTFITFASQALLLLLPCLTSSAILSRNQNNIQDTVLRFHGFEEGRKNVDTLTPAEVTPTLPPFCNGLDCPDFQILEDEKDYQLRKYNLTHWVSTTSVGIDYKVASMEDFERLFQYISGKNKEERKVAMTAPVLIRLIPGPGPACADNFTMSFYVSPSEGTPPQPSDPTVSLTDLPGMKVYVRWFSGFANKDKWLEEAVKLSEVLEKKGLAYVKEYYYTAGYDSPFKLTHRHNEIWILAQD